MVTDSDCSGTALECDLRLDQAPFVLRIVDADGDLHAVNDGGFWSREFWIQPLLSPSSTSAISSTTSTTSTTMISSSSTSTISTSSSTTTSSQLSSSSAPTESSATSAKSSTFPKISASTTTLPFTPNPWVPTHLVTSTPSSFSSLVPSAASSNPSSPLSQSVAIGVGVGVGVGAALLLGAATLFLWRRRGRSHERQTSVPPPPYPESNVIWDARQELYQPDSRPFKSLTVGDFIELTSCGEVSVLCDNDCRRNDFGSRVEQRRRCTMSSNADVSYKSFPTDAWQKAVCLGWP
ncbi:hypothetical protein KC336_g25 [Hortaea werneckii]|nr:hypothetical protein KC336_g25 [Hortaea werneckii]